MTAGFRRRYGHGPLHLLAQLVAIALAGYAASRVLAENGPWLALLVWFVGAALGHDLVLYPLYALADAAGQFRLLRRSRPLPAPAGVPWINHVRVPLALSGLLFLIWFPLILGGRAQAFLDTTGVGTEVYLGRWLAVSGALLLGSAVVYAVRVRLTRRSAGDG
jgi:hypothetical protein